MAQVLSGQCWVVFFSPSGVQFSLPLLKAYCDMKTLKVYSHMLGHCLVQRQARTCTCMTCSVALSADLSPMHICRLLL